MNSYVYESKTINEKFNVESIKISYAENSKDLGHFGFRKIFITAGVFFKLFYKLLLFRPHLIYFQISPLGGAFIRDSFFSLLIKLFRVKIVFHLHGKGIDDYVKRNKILKWYYRGIFKNEYIITLSNSIKNDIVQIYDKEPFVVNNGIKPIVFESRLKNNKITQILFLSNLNSSKGVFDIIKACKNLSEKNIDYNLRIVGAPTKELSIEKLQLKIDELSLKEQVILCNSKYGDEKLQEYKKADIFVFPTKNDAWDSTSRQRVISVRSTS